MSMCGGGGGYAKSTTTNEPWGVQGDYLRELFKPGVAAMTGINRNGDYVDPNSYEGGQLWDAYKGVDQYGNNLPSKLEYIGDKYNGMWRNFNELEGSQKGLEAGHNPSTTGLQMTAAPTVAGFSPQELNAQNIIIERLKGNSNYNGFQTGASNLIPNAKTSLGNIVTGSNRINPSSFSSANVSAPSTIDNPSIGTPDSMTTPTIGNTDLGYRYWDDLGQMAGGQRNSYLEDMISNAKSNLWNDYNNYAVPGTDTTAEAAGRYGGNTWAKLRSDLYDKTSKNAGQIETSMRGDAYNADMNRALQAMNLGGDLATTQSGMDANRALNQANLEMERRAKEYETSAAAKQLTGQLGLQADTAQAGNELQRNIQNAQLQQQANEGNAQLSQQANIQNIANILQSTGMAPTLSQSDYEDIAKLAAVGEAQGAKQQDIIDAYTNRFNFNQTEPMQRLSFGSNILSGDLGGITNSTAPTTSGGGCF